MECNEITTRARLRLIDKLDAITRAPEFDVFFSIIVLQHNPPPLIYRMLHLIFEKVNRHGFVYFQVPVWSKNYVFSIKNYMESIEKENLMEMHALPQTYLFRALDEHGFRILDLQRDNFAGGEMVGVIGPDGVGKSTLLALISGVRTIQGPSP